ncbi:hypothetical protein FA15DRAFT_606008 [Coprinopsis marcescibilis]|uniref:Thioester reductase (TE) domain-containing protein n=1 Tax=Coprinopsis marcescibilis TaxID=230819 RepID=A0A5C3KA53_COPMA|nr:hypothetical protein FA15DRAFT_606008 [Coprinopsis marcescibilis]
MSALTFSSGGRPGPVSIKEGEVPASFVLELGYAESKWVAERLLSRASEACGLSSLVVRVGQISGGHKGAWNTNEWFPSVVMSAKALGSFPILDKTLCANALVDFSQRAIIGHKVVHLIHPQATMWQSIASTVSKELDVPLIPVKECFSMFVPATTSSLQKEMESLTTEAYLRYQL